MKMGIAKNQNPPWAKETSAFQTVNRQKQLFVDCRKTNWIMNKGKRKMKKISSVRNCVEFWLNKMSCKWKEINSLTVQHAP